MFKNYQNIHQRSKEAAISVLNKWTQFKSDKKKIQGILSNEDHKIHLQLSSLNQLEGAWLLRLYKNQPALSSINIADKLLEGSFKELTEDEERIHCSNASSSWHINSKNRSIELLSKCVDANQDPMLINVLNTDKNPEIAVGGGHQAHGFATDAQGLSFSISLNHGETFYGGGEDFQSLTKNGCANQAINMDALGVGSSKKYHAHPSYWSSQGYLLVVLNDSPVSVDVGHKRNEILTVTSSEHYLDLVIYPQQDPQIAIGNFRKWFAPPRAVPRWSQKLWLSRCYYQDQNEVEQVVKTSQEKGIPLGVINLDARSWMRADYRTDFEWDTSRFDHYSEFIPKLREQGIQTCLWENPYVSSKSELFTIAKESGFFAKDKKGNTLEFYWVPRGLKGFPETPSAGIVDFTNPEAWTWWKQLHKPYIKAGVQCFKTDFGEEIPPEAQFANGRNGWQMRNVYSDLYNMCVTEALDEELGEDGVIWARSGFLHSSQTPIKWAGDCQTNWRSLRATLKAGLSQAVCGPLYWSYDTGGFYGDDPSPELYLRWLQMGLWASHVRCHGLTSREPWSFGEEVFELAKTAIELRQALEPYFIDAYKFAQATATSFLQPLWLLHPEEPSTKFIDDQFMAGHEVLVAPFLSPQGGRSFYLPKGEWLDLRFNTTLKGGRYHRSPRTKFLPCFYKLGGRHEALFKDLGKKFSLGGHV